jgi:hypothetical protein
MLITLTVLPSTVLRAGAATSNGYQGTAIDAG